MINYILSLVIIQFRLSTSWIKFGKLSFSKSFSIFLCFQIYWHNISIIFFYYFFSHCSFLFLSLFICTFCPFSIEAFLSLINFINHFKDLWVAFADTKATTVLMNFSASLIAALVFIITFLWVFSLSFLFLTS